MTGKIEDMRTLNVYDTISVKKQTLKTSIESLMISWFKNSFSSITGFVSFTSISGKHDIRKIMKKITNFIHISN